jgi:regulator of protease activity HflC (stomatin/prohibitin superfamily)
MAQQQQEVNMKKVLPIAIIIGGIILLVIFWNQMTITMKPGERGVVFKTFMGGIDENKLPMGEGFHFIAPWNKAIVYNVRQKEVSEVMKVLSSNGLEIEVDLTVLYYPEENSIGRIHKEIGPNYQGIMIIPTIRSATRSVIGRYTPEELYSSKRNLIQNEMFKEIEGNINSDFVRLDKVLIRSIILPQSIKSAIEAKLKQEQLSLEYEFKLKKEEKEAQRKKIAAEGEAMANKIINSSLTDELLKMRGIEATLDLSKSNNAKVVVIGSAKDGLPLILGNN